MIIMTGTERIQKSFKLEQTDSIPWVPFEVKFVTDPEKLIKFGILRTPTVILKKYTIKSQAKVPSVDVITEWLKEV